MLRDFHILLSLPTIADASPEHLLVSFSSLDYSNSNSCFTAHDLGFEDNMHVNLAIVSAEKEKYPVGLFDLYPQNALCPGCFSVSSVHLRKLSMKHLISFSFYGCDRLTRIVNSDSVLH